MFGHQIEKVYFCLRALGLVRSRRDYGRIWLGRAQTMMRDMHAMGRSNALVRRDAVDHLRSRLDTLASIVPAGVARDVKAVIAEIDCDVKIASQLMAGR